MAIYSLHLESRICGHGQTAISRAAYVSASKIKSERTGEISDFHKKKNVAFTELLLPNGCPPISRSELWNGIEAAITTKNQCYGKTGHIALPHEWTDEECTKYMREFLTENFVKDGYAVDWAFHKKKGNHHADIFIPQLKLNEQGEFVRAKTKTVFANDRDKEGNPIFNREKPFYDPQRKEETKQYKIPQIDPKTGEQKVRIRKGKGKEYLWERVNIEDETLNNPEFLKQLRQNWQDFANARLEPEQHIDCRSLKEQGVDRIPQIHVGATGYALEKQESGSSDRFNINEEIKKGNEEVEQMESQYRTLRQLLQAKRNEIILITKKAFERAWERLQASIRPQKEQEPKVWTPPEKQPETVPEFLKKFRKQTKNIDNQPEL